MTLEAPRRFSALPRPFLRWAGSKQALLPHLHDILPIEYNRYFEPFLGSGALFFYLQPKVATLSDSSHELIGTWRAVQKNVDLVVDFLAPLKPDRDLFYQIRANRSSDSKIRAGEFLYLNKTCWNGLYRVNAKGEFNVPFGAPKTDFIFDEVNLRECSKALRRRSISIKCCDFKETLSHCKRNDFVYLDPPYVTKHNNNGFRDWNEKLFSWNDQIRLSEIARELKNAGIKIIVSNANHKDIVSLYKGFKIKEFERSSTLSSSSRYRGAVGEVLLYANT